jgi:DNA-binding MarR family transcriptional regulator
MNEQEPRPIGMEIRRTNRAISNYIERNLSEKLHLDLTGVEGLILSFIFRNQDKALTAKNIMERFNVSKATTSQSLNGLEKKGSIVMVSSKEDRRVKTILLTAKGKEENDLFRALFAEMNGEIEKHLTEEEKLTLRSILSRIRENVGDDSTCTGRRK